MEGRKKDEEVYCGSADWMPRNLFERCEVVFPIRDPQIGARVRNEILAAQLADRAKARVLNASGDYRRIAHNGSRSNAFNSQDFFIQVAEGKASQDDIPVPKPHPQPTTRKPRIKKTPSRE